MPTARHLTIERIRASPHDDDLARVAAMLDEADKVRRRYHLHGLDRVWSKAELGALGVEVRNRLHQLSIGVPRQSPTDLASCLPAAAGPSRETDPAAPRHPRCRATPRRARTPSHDRSTHGSTPQQRLADTETRRRRGLTDPPKRASQELTPITATREIRHAHLFCGVARAHDAPPPESRGRGEGRLPSRHRDRRSRRSAWPQAMLGIEIRDQPRLRVRSTAAAAATPDQKRHPEPRDQRGGGGRRTSHQRGGVRCSPRSSPPSARRRSPR